MILKKQQADPALQARKLMLAQWEQLQVAEARYAKLKDERKQASFTTSEVCRLWVVYVVVHDYFIFRNIKLYFSILVIRNSFSVAFF